MSEEEKLTQVPIGAEGQKRGLSLVMLLVLALALLHPDQPAHADWPIIQTTDEQTVLNLNKPENQIDILECGLWLAKEHGNYYLRSIKGKRIPVPNLAVKSIQDRAIANIALDAKLFGLQARMMSLTYVGEGARGAWNSYSWSSENLEKYLSTGFLSQYISFLIDGDQKKLTDAIRSSIPGNSKLRAFTSKSYPPEQKYGHYVIELLETSELSQGNGLPSLGWALLARGLSNTVNPPFFKVRFDGETGEIDWDSPYRHSKPQLQKIINATKPIRTELRYACILAEDVPRAIPQ